MLLKMEPKWKEEKKNKLKKVCDGSKLNMQENNWNFVAVSTHKHIWTEQHQHQKIISLVNFLCIFSSHSISFYFGISIWIRIHVFCLVWVLNVCICNMCIFIASWEWTIRQKKMVWYSYVDVFVCIRYIYISSFVSFPSILFLLPLNGLKINGSLHIEASQVN